MDAPTVKKEDEEAKAEPALAQAIKKSKKKKKLKKLTPKQKALEKLEKAAENLLKDPARSNKLFETIAHWLSSNDKTVNKVLNQQVIYSLENELHKKNIKTLGLEESDEESSDDDDALSSNLITYDDFKIATADLGIPCTHVELHALCKLMDPEMEGLIEYKNFTYSKMLLNIRHKEIDGVKFVAKSMKNENPLVKGIVFKQNLAQNFASQYPLYIKVDLRLIAFANDKECKMNLRNTMVSTHLKILDLIELIKERTEISSNRICIYRDLCLESLMENSKTLDSYGFVGGDYNTILSRKEKVAIFYDYDILDNDDPILNCDFYYHNYKYIPRAASRNHKDKMRNIVAHTFLESTHLTCAKTPNQHI